MASNLRQIDVTTSFAPLPDLACEKVSILNTSGAALDIRFASETAADELITLPTGLSVAVPVVANAKEIEIKGPGAVSDGVQVVTQ